MEQSTLKFFCKGMEDGGQFPVKYTGWGENTSPEFTIQNLSPDAKTLAITLEDLSHPIRDFTHWVIWNIPVAETIKEAIPAGKIVSSLGNAKQGIGYGLHRYSGPKPPKGKTHIYRFTLYSLDDEIILSANTGKGTFLRRAQNHILQKGSIIAKYE